MATNPRLRSMQQQIQQQGLTRDQAKGKYNLTDQDADWMNNNLGLRFAPAGAKPTGLMGAGQAGTAGSAGPIGAVTRDMVSTAGGQSAASIQTSTTPAPADATATATQTSSGPTAAAGPIRADAASQSATSNVISPVTQEMVAANSPPPPAGARTTPAPPSPPIITPPPPPPPANTPVPDADAAAVTEADAVVQGKVAAWRPGTNATVQGQLAGLLDSGSPLMEQAATRGLQAANSRGMANSSMGIQSSQAALYDAALPIATQDANTFAQAGQFNANERNDQRAHNADLKTQTNLHNSGLATDISKFNASESNALTKLGMDNDTRRDLANIEATYKTLMQTSASAGEIYKQYMGAVATILQSKDMDAVAKQEAINGLMGALNSSLDVVGGIGNLDIPDLEFQELATVGQAINGFPLPNAISGYGTINWNATLKNTDASLRDMYNEYATENPDTALSPEAWYIKFRLKINDVTGGVGGGTGNTGGSGGGGGDSGGSGTGSPGSGDTGP